MIEPRKILLFSLLPLAAGGYLALGSAAARGEEEVPPEGDKPSGFQFTTEISIPCTPIKNQAQTSTCWSFATVSFWEAELLRMGKGKFDLSEMFLVRHIYPLKAIRYVRLHGNATLGPGSLAQDALRVIRDHGLVPEQVYGGRLSGQRRHNHGELDAVLQGMLAAIVANHGKTLTPAWPQAMEGVLNAYLGTPPQQFAFQDKQYTPRSFADELGIRPEDYIELTSFTHHPFYQPFALEIPDNWAGNLAWNVPLNELMQTLDRALTLGYSVAWDGDVSERSFQHKKGVAILPEKPWETRTTKEQDAVCDAPEPELKVDQQLRQQHFDNYSSTDDHLMHIVGTARDQHGTRYYRTKNSWGTRDSEGKGYVHISEPYARCKTMSILVHREALPDGLKARLALPAASAK